MKALGLIGMILGILAMGLGIYLVFVVADAASAARMADDLGPTLYGDAYYGSPMHMINRSAMDFKTDFGIIVMGAGLVAFLASIVPAIKKQTIAWVGLGLGLISFFIGAAYGTHMFS
jgi:uncharacterized membrane protein YbaN (DUF454 family)